MVCTALAICIQVKNFNQIFYIYYYLLKEAIRIRILHPLISFSLHGYFKCHFIEYVSISIFYCLTGKYASVEKSKVLHNLPADTSSLLESPGSLVRAIVTRKPNITPQHLSGQITYAYNHDFERMNELPFAEQKSIIDGAMRIFREEERENKINTDDVIAEQMSNFQEMSNAGRKKLETNFANFTELSKRLTPLSSRSQLMQLLRTADRKERRSILRDYIRDFKNRKTMREAENLNPSNAKVNIGREGDGSGLLELCRRVESIYEKMWLFDSSTIDSADPIFLEDVKPPESKKRKNNSSGKSMSKSTSNAATKASKSSSKKASKSASKSVSVESENESSDEDTIGTMVSHSASDAPMSKPQMDRTSFRRNATNANSRYFSIAGISLSGLFIFCSFTY